MDRALPLLKPGKSFQFAMVEGGKDADEVLREQGPAALKAQLANSTPFAEALFMRERDAEPLRHPGAQDRVEGPPAQAGRQHRRR